jgi:hypothetical protein
MLKFSSFVILLLQARLKSQRFRYYKFDVMKTIFFQIIFNFCFHELPLIPSEVWTFVVVGPPHTVWPGGLDPYMAQTKISIK